MRAGNADPLRAWGDTSMAEPREEPRTPAPAGRASLWTAGAGAAAARYRTVPPRVGQHPPERARPGGAGGDGRPPRCRGRGRTRSRRPPHACLPPRAGWRLSQAFAPGVWRGACLGAAGSGTGPPRGIAAGPPVAGGVQGAHAAGQLRSASARLAPPASGPAAELAARLRP